MLLALVVLTGCSRDPVVPKGMTGSPAAVAGLPRFHRRDRLLIESCCTVQLATSARSAPLQGIDSVIQAISGPGYTLKVVFGPYDTGPPQSGYRPADRRVIDGVVLNGFEWLNLKQKPPEGRMLWLARVGGGTIDGVIHQPWGLRIMASCNTPAACRASTALVETLRF